MGADNLLIVSDSERDANMLYAVGMFAPDPFIYMRLKGRPHIVVGDLELDRARREASHCRVVSLSACVRSLKQGKAKPVGLAHVIRLLARASKVDKFLVPSDFPYGLACVLRRLKVKLKVKSGSFFPERERKDEAEVRKISAAIMMAEVGLAECVQALKSSKIDHRGRLIYRNAPLTSEKLRSIINVAVLQAGGIPSRTIVAGSRQSCDPHEVGHGPLRAHEPIIVDVFPRSQKTGYFGDITRTFVRGRASETIRRLHRAVMRGQELAFSMLCVNARGPQIHKAVQDYFDSQGYETSRRRGRMHGFFHGTGHGLGLEVHECPRINATSDVVLRSGNVVTVEPGLYYPNLGGVRLEDVAFITRKGTRNLTKFEKVLEI